MKAQTAWLPGGHINPHHDLRGGLLVLDDGHKRLRTLALATSNWRPHGARDQALIVNSRLEALPLGLIVPASMETLDCVKHTAALFTRDARTRPRLLSVGLHPHLIGVPHRFAFFEEMLDLLMQTPGICFGWGHAIADGFTGQVPAPAAHGNFISSQEH